MRLRIAYLSNSHLEHGAANSVHVMNMCSCFAGMGHEVVLFTRGNIKENIFSYYGIQQNFSIKALDTGSIRLISILIYGFIQSLKVKFLNKADLIYARCLITAFFAQLIMRVPIIIEMHEVPHNKPLGILCWFLFKNKNTRRVIAISAGLKKDLMQQYPLLKEKDVLIAHDGASISKDRSVDFLLDKGPGCQIGYAGGLRVGNGIDLIIELASIFSQHTFHVLGGTEIAVKKWSEHQKSDNIVWYGHRPASSIFGFLSSCDVLLAPYQDGPKTGAGRDTSRWMSPLKIFEYMAAKTAMIVSDFPVLREVLNDEMASFVFPGDLKGWERALSLLINNEGRRLELAENAFYALKKEYTWSVRARRVLHDIG